jgi:Ser/Thr protein kinase RdoA (MazF antagonist)
MKPERECRQAVARAYARKRLLPKLGLPDQEVEVRVPTRGERSLVFLLTFAGRDGETVRAALRMVPRAMVAWTTWMASRLLARKGVRVPRLLAADLSPLTRLRFGGFALCEEEIVGRHVDEAGFRPDDVRAAARTLGALHRIARSRHGDPLVGRGGSIARYHHKRTCLALARLRGYPDGAPLAAAAEPWLARAVGALDDGRPFGLLHGRLNGGNLIVDAAGEAWLIDVWSARYDCPEREIVRALHRLTDSPAGAEAFLDTYFAAREPGAADAYERRGPFFHAQFHLYEAVRRFRRIERYPGEPHLQEEAAHNLEALQALVSGAAAR